MVPTKRRRPPFVRSRLARTALAGTLAIALAAAGCGDALTHREATLVWQALVDSRIVEPVTLNAVAGNAAYVAPLTCAYAGHGQSFTLHTFVAADAAPDAPAELTGYVRYELRACQSHKNAPMLSGSLHRGLQSRRQATGEGQDESGESAYEHITGTLQLGGEVRGSCTIDLHRTLQPGRPPRHEGVVCGLPADHVAR